MVDGDRSLKSCSKIKVSIYFKKNRLFSKTCQTFLLINTSLLILAQIVIAGGFKIGLFNDRSYIEVIHLINPNLSFTFQDKRLSKVHVCNGGGILQNQLLICGGRQAYKKTHIYDNDIVVLGQQRWWTSTVRLLTPHSKVLLMGSYENFLTGRNAFLSLALWSYVVKKHAI